LNLLLIYWRETEIQMKTPLRSLLVTPGNRRAVANRAGLGILPPHRLWIEAWAMRVEAPPARCGVAGETVAF